MTIRQARFYRHAFLAIAILACGASRPAFAQSVAPAVQATDAPATPAPAASSPAEPGPQHHVRFWTVAIPVLAAAGAFTFVQVSEGDARAYPATYVPSLHRPAFRLRIGL